MVNGLASYVVNGEIDKVLEYSESDIINYSFEEAGDLFLLAAANGQVELAKALINKLEESIAQQKISVHDVIKFITAVIPDSKENAWAIAAFYGHIQFLDYLYELRDKYSFYLKNWDIFQINAEEDRHIKRVAIHGDAGSIDYFLQEKGALIHICERGMRHTFASIYNYILELKIVPQAKILLVTNSKGMTALAAALNNQHFDIAEQIYALIEQWFEKALTIDEIRNHQTLNKMLKMYLNDYLDRVDLSKKSLRHAACKKLILDSKIDQDLKLPKLHSSSIMRDYRSFVNERERQLLRQVATQLYLAFKDFLKQSNESVSSFKEVQLMFLQSKGTQNLYIAINEVSMTKKFGDFLLSANLKDILSNAINVKGDAEGVSRTKRYAKKLKTRLFAETLAIPKGTNDEDTDHVNVIASILVNQKMKRLPINILVDEGKGGEIRGLMLEGKSKSYIRHTLKQTNNIYVIDVEQYPGSADKRHAEEFLVDIAEIARDEGKAYSSIAGKKRPCMSCSGRMKNNIDQYNLNPGGFWITTIDYQSPKVARETLKLLFTENVNISRGKAPHIQNNANQLPAPDYDTGSDSDGEDAINYKERRFL